MRKKNIEETVTKHTLSTSNIFIKLAIKFLGIKIVNNEKGLIK